MIDDSSRRTQIALERSSAVVGKPSRIHARRFDKQFNPRKDKQVDAELIYKGEKAQEDSRTPVKLNAMKGRPGEYSVLVPHDRAGRYELQVRNPDVNTYSFNVELPPKHELAGIDSRKKPWRRGSNQQRPLLSRGRLAPVSRPA